MSPACAADTILKRTRLGQIPVKTITWCKFVVDPKTDQLFVPDHT